jgi:simple sugar transport system ATP-binding protein
MIPPRLALRGITKRYGETIANAAVDLDVAVGQIHALLGENGAGKSTLMKIAAGVTTPDAGRIEWQGAPVSIRNPAQARRLGIGMVFQHFALFDTLTVAENIALGLGEPPPGRELVARITAVGERYGVPIDARRSTHALSVGERQRVEIVRCLLQHPRLLILDEPTSVLTPQAVFALFATLRRLAAEGVSILYISHKLDEIRALCDVATVLRNGRVNGTVVPRAESNASLARLMIGGDLPECRLRPLPAGEVRLALRDLSLASADPFGTSLQGLDLQVRAGELVGIAGVAGNGQGELLAALSGETLSASAGAVSIGKDAVGRQGPAARRRLGLRYVPEERLGRGTVPEMNLSENCVLTGAGDGLVRRGLVQLEAARRCAREIMDRFAVKAPGEQALAASLSGGNVQKFIVGREIRFSPRVLLVAQPTWGVDVGAAIRIRQELIDLRDAGVAILVLSEELDELFTICDRIAVLAGGRLSPALARKRWTAESIGIAMTGDFTALPGMLVAVADGGAGARVAH